jgi:A/G-specific adenine glycosylase
MTGDTAIAAALVHWYARARRDLPWRRTRDPYAIWVSEVMLQQTRVDTVLPYWQRFLERWPTVRALAEAPLDDVLQAWSGLGYYRRARQLHLAAADVVARHQGELPRSARELEGLRGVGRYTAGAIASIAFDEPAPIVDGNVARVLSRVFALDDDPASTRGKRRLWELAESLVPPRDPGSFNQALMELGATVCTPRAPRCDACPLRASCAALAEGRVDELPRSAPRTAPRALALVAAVAEHGGAFLLAQRAPDGLYGGLWEPPLVEASSLASAREALAAHGVPARVRLEEAGRVRHVLSHRRLDVLVVRAGPSRRWTAPRRAPAPYARIAWRPLDAVALSTLARKLIGRKAVR